jgi:hypothetical protein
MSSMMDLLLVRNLMVEVRLVWQLGIELISGWFRVVLRPGKLKVCSTTLFVGAAVPHRTERRRNQAPALELIPD